MNAPNSPVDREAVLGVLSTVVDPDLHRDIVTLGFVKNLMIEDGIVRFDVELTTPACPVKDALQEECRKKVAGLDGVREVHVRMTANVTSRNPAPSLLPEVRNIVAVASGKGGVGKSTCAVNLALALADTGAKVGLLDADVYGPSIPTMLGVERRPQVTPDQKLVPIPRAGLMLMSMGFLADERTPVIWRGPMVSGVLQQLLGQVLWGALDYLVVDMPPGTGDAALTLSQVVQVSGAVIVTTPQEVSLVDARKSLHMFEKVNVPILGILENMSFLPQADGSRLAIFGAGGGRRFADDAGVPFLGELAIDPRVAEGGDRGQPIFLAEPDSAVAQTFREVAGKVAAQLAVANAQGAGGGLQLEWGR